MQYNSNNINKIDLILHTNKNNIATVPIRSGVLFSQNNIRKYTISLLAIWV